MPEERLVYVEAQSITQRQEWTVPQEWNLNDFIRRSYDVEWVIPDVDNPDWNLSDASIGWVVEYSGGILIPPYSGQMFARGGAYGTTPGQPSFEPMPSPTFFIMGYSLVSSVVQTHPPWPATFDSGVGAWKWRVSPDVFGFRDPDNTVSNSGMSYSQMQLLDAARAGGGTVHVNAWSDSSQVKPGSFIYDYCDVRIIGAICRFSMWRDVQPPPPALPIKSLVSAAYKDEAVAVASLSANADANNKRQLSIHVTRAGFCAGAPWASYVLRSVDADSKIGLAWIEPQTLVVNYVIGGVKTYQTNKCMGRAGYWSAPAALTPAAQILNSGLGQGQAFRVRTS